MNTKSNKYTGPVKLNFKLLVKNSNTQNFLKVVFHSTVFMVPIVQNLLGRYLVRHFYSFELYKVHFIEHPL